MSSVTTAQYTWDLLTCEVDVWGDRIWCDEDRLPHRENGPASIWPDGSRFWYKHGSRHREDGPAVIWPDGEVEYWLDGEPMTEEEFNARMQRA